MDDFKDIDDDEVDRLVEDGDKTEFQRLLEQNQKLTNTLLDITGVDTPDEVKVKARNFALVHLENALNTISDLMHNAEKDSTRLAAARTIWNIASGTSEKDGSSGIEDLFKRLDGTK